MVKVVTVLAIGALSCAPGAVTAVRPGAGTDLPVIELGGFEGVVFPEAMAVSAARSLGIIAAGAWTPQPEHIASLEAELRKVLGRGRETPSLLDPTSVAPERLAWVSRSAATILEGYPHYRRQYIGIVLSNGARRVLVNSFSAAGIDPPDLHADWRRQVIAANDGWYRYWQIQYDVDTGLYFEFECNGGA